MSARLKSLLRFLKKVPCRRSNHVFFNMSGYWCPNLICIEVSKPVFGGKISNFKTFVSTDSIGKLFKTTYLHVKTCATLKSVSNFFLKRMELGKNPTDDLCNCSKWSFWQASMKIHLILVYWDARNSLPYNLVMPFKDGITFAVTTATQSYQRCYLENYQIWPL